MLKNLILFFRNISCKIISKLQPISTINGSDYFEIVDNKLRQSQGLKIVDIGAGRNTKYKDLSIIEDNNHILIGADISGEELSYNTTIHDKVICDASKCIDIQSESVDLITSCYCVEHLQDTEKFISEASRVLKTEGELMLIFAGGKAIHSCLNKLLPHHLSRKLLFTLIPGSDKGLGFKAYYHLCTKREFSQTLIKYGFHINNIDCGYTNASYFGFFPPLCLLVLLIDIIFCNLRIEQFAQFYIVSATKK